jgi:hypothetical protein
MSSGSPSQIVQLVGGPSRRSPSRRQTGVPSSFPQRSWSAASTAAFAACSPCRVGQPLADLLERERIVPEQLLGTVEKRECRIGALLVTLDRGRLAEARLFGVRDRYVDDLRLVLGAPRDRERLGERDRRLPGAQLHDIEISTGSRLRFASGIRLGEL